MIFFFKTFIIYHILKLLVLNITLIISLGFKVILYKITDNYILIKILTKY